VRIFSSADEAAREFAMQHFCACDMHQAEAIAVYNALEHLCERELPAIEPAKLVREILTAPTRLTPSVSDSNFGTNPLDCIEFAMAVEEEQGSMSDQEMDDVMKHFSKTEHVFNTLLGSVAGASTWDPATIWVRSIRTIVNERVRHRGGCTCE
jgi:hypothetical protein